MRCNLLEILVLILVCDVFIVKCFMFWKIMVDDIFVE